jgi:CBS domain-containing protein
VFNDFQNSLGAVVEDVMTTEVTSVREGDSLAEALGTLAQARVHRAPVVRDDGVVVGVLSVTDILGWISQRLNRGG